MLAAIRNNVALCAAVCRTHGVSSHVVDGLRRTDMPAPLYYPDIIIADRSVSAARIAGQIAGPGVGSLKDSFAALDLSGYGFAPLFDAQWIYLDPSMETANSQLNWTRVVTPAALDDWRAAHGSADSIRPELLVMPGFSVLEARDGAGGRAGLIANVSDDVIGLSNFFQEGIESVFAWREAALMMATLFPGCAIVGYEHGDDLAAATEVGWQAIGPLRVWLRGS